jgi:GT2 family glycosyltransferase
MPLSRPSRQPKQRLAERTPEQEEESGQVRWRPRRSEHQLRVPCLPSYPLPPDGRSSRERYGPLAVQRTRELGEDRQVRVKPHSLDMAHSQRRESPFALEASKGLLDGCTAPVEALPAQRLARDQRVQAVGLDPHRCGLTFAGRAAPLGCLAVVVGSSEAPLAAAGITDQIKVVLADAGYWASEQIENLAASGIQVLVPPDSDSSKRDHGANRKGPRYDFMRRVIASENGRALYRQRQPTIEPIFGQIVGERAGGLHCISSPPVISIVIPVKNGGSDLARCLGAISSQRIDEEVEVVVIDSGSSDGSVGLARSHGALVREIAPQEFSHGSSRNLGASLARGELLVFLSQDAHPVDERWLQALTHPLREDPNVVGVYGRQLPHEGARPPEVYFLDFLYGPHPRLQQVGSARELNMQTTLFSNVNSSMPRTAWEQFPFVEDIVMSEDQDWSRRVLLSGKRIAYEPAAAVRHSHNYTLLAALRRFFDSGASAERAYLAGERESTKVLRSAAIRYASGELRWLWGTRRRRWIPYAVVYESVKMVGLVLGANHHRLPLGLKRRLSALPSFWER